MGSWWESRALLAAVVLGIGALATAAETPPLGFGAHGIAGPADEITPELRQAIQHRIDGNVAALRAQRTLPSGAGPHVLFDWPLRLAVGFSELGFHGISNFVDQDPAYPSHLLDWSCGARTYDLASGYNHQGTDIFLAPFPWSRMDAGEVEIVAAAPGTIVARDDGNFDRNCGFNNLTPNAVYVMHADGSVAWYLHMQSGSPTAKTVGQTVMAGEYLGRVGSSGSSTGPHLHFEVHDQSSALVDPFFVGGGCNALATDTWWNAQRPYLDSAVNKVMTGTAPWADNGCPSDETTHERDDFVRGTTVYFTTWYRDALDGQTATMRVRRPDDTVFCSFPFTWNIGGSGVYATAYSYMYCTITAGEALGTWHSEVDYLGQTRAHPFEVVLSTTTTTSTSTTLATATTTISSTTTTTVVPPFTIDHFLLYGVKPMHGQPKFVARGRVHLVDGFRSADYVVAKPVSLGFPVDADGGGTNDGATHLEELALKDSLASKFDAVPNVLVRNECGDLSVEVKKPRSLLVPAAMGRATAPPAPGATGVDRYLCYAAKMEGKFPKGVQVDLLDELQPGPPARSPRRYDLKTITKLCAPAAESGSPVQHPAENLVCYKAKVARKLIPQTSCRPATPGDLGTTIVPAQPRHVPIVGLYSTTELGTDRLDTVKEVELCIPSTKMLGS